MRVEVRHASFRTLETILIDAKDIVGLKIWHYVMIEILIPLMNKIIRFTILQNQEKKLLKNSLSTPTNIITPKWNPVRRFKIHS
jgi:hypothetical protein